MLSLPHNTRIFLHVPATDLRKSFDGLGGLVRSAFGGDPCDGSWYLFFNRRRDRVKILYWDRDGLALWYKRLEKQKFCWPKSHEAEMILSSSEQLQKLLFGFDVFQKPHDYLKYHQIY